MSILGLDIGTTGCKAIVINQAGEILSRASCQYPLITPKPGWAELDSMQVWKAALASMRKAIHDTAGDPLQAISVSAMGDSIIPCDHNFQPLHNCILAFDTRNTPEAGIFEEKIGRKRIFEVTGQPVHPTYSITKVLWIKNHLPELFENTRYFLCFEDFITAQLCGIAAISYSSVARTMAFDINTFCWDQQILDVCNINEEKFATPLPSGKIVANLKKEVADHLGLKDMVKVVVGGHDQPCGALGCGLFEAGCALDSTGTVEVLLVTHSEAILSEEMLEANICFWPHVISGEYCACGQILTAGAAFRWFKDNFAQFEIALANEKNLDAYNLITSGFPSLPTDLLFIPHLSGSGTPEFTPLAKGAIYGISLQTTKYDLAKAILEGISFELKLNIDLLEKARMPINSLRSVGGAANSREWMQLKADITGKQVAASQFADQCPYGAALLAGYGIGIFDDLKQVSRKSPHKFLTFEPDIDSKIIYEKKFMDYLKFRFNVFDLYEKF